jgi:uncharacterized membrane protein YcjF (UPF0283 family)
MGRLDWDDLSSLIFGMAVAGALIGSFGFGLWARRLLPARHQTHESLEIVHAVIGMLVAMIAILLGLQLDSATKSFDDMEQLVERYSIQIVQLDALLRDYGPAASGPPNSVPMWPQPPTASSRASAAITASRANCSVARGSASSR